MKKKMILLFSTFLFVSLLVNNSCNKDECDKLTWYQDYDADGYGNSEVTLHRCEQPDGYVIDSTDFNDSSAYAYPGAMELCTDRIDNDNDGFIDCDDWDCDLDCDESKNCYDGIDNDNDGYTDCDDFDCDCDESKNCDDGIDNDNDGFIDCDDFDCDCK